MRTYTILICLIALSAACGRGIDDKGSKSSNSSNSSSSNSTSSNNDVNADTNGGTTSCGDGVLDAGELCDPGIASGPGACPQSCGAPACATAMVVGSAAACNAQCIVEPLACANGDGCCPTGCDAGNDNDCSNSCGDGVVDGPETCDGDCPTSCSDGDACTTDTLTGSAAQCSASCEFELVVSCTSGDGCCPAGCTASRDNDCEPTATCGDGTIDPGELCDGNCPTSCNDNNACTTDRLSGSPATCNAQCSHTAITSCVNGDGCCAPGCTFANDNDCACIPKTCASMGAECGTISDGCGRTVTCSNTCTSLETCSNNQCVGDNLIGQDCTDYPQCGSSPDAACILPPDWPGGYCSIICNSATNTMCPAGSHCADFDGTNSLCLLNCTSDAQCEDGYVCRQWDNAGGRECVPPEPPAGSGTIGSACGSNSDCAAGLTCETTATDSQSGAVTTFPGGMCTQSCIPVVLACPTGAICSLELICVEQCTTDLDCRTGYSCVTGLGGPYCWPD